MLFLHENLFERFLHQYNTQTLFHSTYNFGGQSCFEHFRALLDIDWGYCGHHWVIPILDCKMHVYVCLHTCAWPYTKIINWTNGNFKFAYVLKQIHVHCVATRPVMPWMWLWIMTDKGRVLKDATVKEKWLHKVLLTMLIMSLEQQTVTNPAVIHHWFVCHEKH